MEFCVIMNILFPKFQDKCDFNLKLLCTFTNYEVCLWMILFYVNFVSIVNIVNNTLYISIYWLKQNLWKQECLETWFIAVYSNHCTVWKKKKKIIILSDFYHSCFNTKITHCAINLRLWCLIYPYLYCHFLSLVLSFFHLYLCVSPSFQSLSSLHSPCYLKKTKDSELNEFIIITCKYIHFSASKFTTLNHFWVTCIHPHTYSIIPVF